MVDLMASLRFDSHVNDTFVIPPKARSSASSGGMITAHQDITGQLLSVAVPADLLSEGALGSRSASLGSAAQFAGQSNEASEPEAMEALPGELYAQSCAICNGGACPCSCGAITPV